MDEKTHVIAKFKHDFAMDPKAVPALTVDSPCKIRFETDDTAYLRASKGESADEIGWHKFNAITGPAYITGAEPGMGGPYGNIIYSKALWFKHSCLVYEKLPRVS